MTAPSMTTADGAGNIGGDTVKQVFYREALFAFRAQNVFRAAADVQWAEGDNPMPGNPVTFTIISALSPATSTIAEATEPTPVNMLDTQVNITLAEYGNGVKDTKKLRLTTYLNLDMVKVREMTNHMEESVDLVARNVLVGGTNVFYAGAATSRVTVAATHNITANKVRQGIARILGRNTPAPGGTPFYPLILHPDIGYDLMAESGQQAWSAPHVYEDTANIYTGEVGELAGARVIQNPNSRNFVDAGVGGTVDVYASLFIGQQALGEAVGEAQHIVISGPFDDLQRFLFVGWYGMLGFGIVRQGSLDRLEAASTIGAN